MHMEELKTKHQLVEKDFELERQVKSTTLEIDDVPSQRTSAGDKSLPKRKMIKKIVSD